MNRVSKTKEEAFPDLQKLREEREAEDRRNAKREYAKRMEAEKAAEKERLAQKALQSYVDRFGAFLRTRTRSARREGGGFATTS